MKNQPPKPSSADAPCGSAASSYPLVVETSDAPYPAPSYAWYVVAVLMVIYVFNFMDRMILNLLVTPIKNDLQISDTQMSYLMGFSFALFYTLLSGLNGFIQNLSRNWFSLRWTEPL